jgi:ATP-dependent RNA helicase DeaD
MTTFADFGLSQPVAQAIAQMGFEEPTPIQEQAIPLILEGKDLIGQAQTGTGKTAAFGIPMIEDIDETSPDVQALVIAPTRELAVQVGEELNRLGKPKGVLTIAVYGGQDIARQIRALKKGPQIVAATPGRLMDHMRRRTIRLDAVELVVLDEADEMLNMGFQEDIESILGALPADRQTLLFSATMPEAIRQIAVKHMRNPTQVTIKAKELTVPHIDQYYIEVAEQQKFEVLCRLFDMQSPELAIVFGRTKRRVDELTDALMTRGYSVEGIHGDLSQARRDQVMRKFRSGAIDVMVATDVAARGLDITDITHVYNFDMPQDPEWYVHRIGRTGRAGKAGVAITFVTPRELGYLRQLERVINRRIERQPAPTLTDAIQGQLRSAAEQLLQVAAREEDLQRYRGWAEQVLANTDSVTLVAAALKIMTREPDQAPVTLTAEAPLRSKRAGGGGRPRSGDERRRDGYGGRGRVGGPDGRSGSRRGQRGQQRSRGYRSASGALDGTTRRRRDPR